MSQSNDTGIIYAKNFITSNTDILSVIASIKKRINIVIDEPLDENNFKKYVDIFIISHSSLEELYNKAFPNKINSDSKQKLTKMFDYIYNINRQNIQNCNVNNLMNIVLFCLDFFNIRGEDILKLFEELYDKKYTPTNYINFGFKLYQVNHFVLSNNFQVKDNSSTV